MSNDARLTPQSQPNIVERLQSQAHDATDWHGETMKQWDKIRAICAERDGSDLPRLMFEGLIESLAELMVEAADRIELLEVSEGNELLALRAKVDELTAALKLAVNMIMACEPGDSRAVSNEAVALAAVSCGIVDEGVMQVINTALAIHSQDRS